MNAGGFGYEMRDVWPGSSAIGLSESGDRHREKLPELLGGCWCSRLLPSGRLRSAKHGRWLDNCPILVRPMSVRCDRSPWLGALLVRRDPAFQPLLSSTETPPSPPSKRRVPRPFLKWVGGKTQLLPELTSRVARVPFTNYVEPFVGGGALFFELARTRRLPSEPVLLDVNGPLISTYKAVRDELPGVVLHLARHAELHSKEHYYSVRESLPPTAAARAARVIYLNKTGFNGLYRENRKGQFNVPMGRYENPKILDSVNLAATSEALQGAVLVECDFEEVLDFASASSFVYFDPPYVPVSRTSAFTSYSEAGFSLADQQRLAAVFRELSRRGVAAMLSNSYTPTVLELYGGFCISEVSATRAVNSDASARGRVSEVIVTNFD